MTQMVHADVVLLTREIPTGDLLEYYADASDAALVTLPSPDGATASVFFAEGDLALVLAVPKMIDYAGDLSRVLGVAEQELPGGARYWTEGVVAVDSSRLGFAVATAVAEHCGGQVVIRASGTVL